MKRPEGFDPPKREASSSPSVPKRPVDPKRPTDPKKGPTVPGPEAGKPKRANAEIEARTTRSDAAGSAAATELAVARAELKRAARERRRYERREVRRFTRRTRNRRAAWLTVLGILVTLVALVGIAVYSPILSLKTIRIEGASKVSSGSIRTAVDNQLGTPLALIDFGQITNDLAKFPLIRSYVTETVPPNTLVIHIVERVPIGAIATPAGFTVVDAAGVTISTSKTRPPGLPLIDVGTTTTKGSAFKASVQVLLALPTAVLSKVDQVTAHTIDDVTLVLTGVGQKVVWGSPASSNEKAKVLADLIAHQAPGVVVEYDVSAPSNAVVRPG
ncbi:MAG: cell division protein FtsQ [Microbacteriaceae bacterium]|jgi:cell division protein FtsQ|nr:cell division protein FtsQ [Microbacteriaceae bacterium]MDQ1554308.1 cell division protein FtsQ [Microbacteriaceae bacterium]